MREHQISTNMVVSISYLLREDHATGPVLERMDNFYPFEFLFGTGALLPKFEQELEGLKEGDSFAFRLDVQDAYGEPSAENILQLERAAFERSASASPEELGEGSFVQLTDDGGMRHNGKVLRKTADFIEVDFNHVMAGKALYFEGEVLSVRPASPAEKIRQHHYGDDGIRRNKG